MLTESLEKVYGYVWDSYSDDSTKELMDFSEGYKDFVSTCKTERECITEFIRIAEEQGFVGLDTLLDKGHQVKSGDKIYAVTAQKALALFVIGREPLENGLRIVGAHVDSPRLDLKQNPLYEDSGLAMLKTHYYGGIKKYQWVTTPLAIHGVVVKKDGTVVNVVIGEEDNDPVVGVSDLLIHLSKDQMDKKMSQAIEGEDLNITVGSIPLGDKEDKDRVKKNILKLLNDKYGITEEDFVSAELEAVPAGKARDYGFDQSMVVAYGHDDRVCAYTAFRAILDVKDPKKTCVALMVDKEEIGSVGATGMTSKFFENAMAEVMNLTGDYSELKLRRCLAKSKMLSADVSAAYDPNFPSVTEAKNSAYLGKGLSFNKYTGVRGKGGSNDANAEFLAEMRELMDKHNVTWQTAELGKVDQGGGGTIAYILAEYGMDVVDCGVPVHNMHAPWEVASKADIYEAMRGYRAFFQDA